MKAKYNLLRNGMGPDPIAAKWEWNESETNEYIQWNGMKYDNTVATWEWNGNETNNFSGME